MCAVSAVEKHLPRKVSFFDQQLQVMNASALPNAVRSRLRVHLLYSQAEPAQGLSSMYTESVWVPRDERLGTSCSHHDERQERGMKSCGIQSPGWIAHCRMAKALVRGGASHSSTGITPVWQGLGTGQAGTSPTAHSSVLTLGSCHLFHTKNWPCRHD